MSVRIAISIGDYNGIGPEVVIKSLQTSFEGDCTPVILGDPRVVDHYTGLLGSPLPYHLAETPEALKEGQINLLNILGDRPVAIDPGTVSAEAGKYAMLAVERGITLCMEGITDALVTASISKEAVNLAGYAIPGHTEFLAEKTDTRDFIMMLVNKGLRVGLISTHVPLAQVPEWVTGQRLTRYLEIMRGSLVRDFALERPRIAVLGLNPHAGDGGMIGTEERDIILPAVNEMQAQGHRIEGPFPADGFFGNRTYREFDGILAMYHDQGLIPFKTLSFGAGVNFTAGLPIIRTSPDHGTAFDIAGSGVASSDSFTQAFELAVSLARQSKSQADEQ